MPYYFPRRLFVNGVGTKFVTTGPFPVPADDPHRGAGRTDTGDRPTLAVSQWATFCPTSAGPLRSVQRLGIDGQAQ